MPQLDGLTPQHSILYLNTGVGVFAGTGSPNGVEKGGIGSQYTNLANGDLYIKTTAFDTLTGWTLVTSGGGSGTVTNFSADNLLPLFTSGVTNPTTTPTLTFAQVSQSQNLVFASPNGSAGNPTFRALVAADLALAAAPPANGIQYNDGTNAFTASNGFKVDPATNTLQVGELNVLKGSLQLQAGSGGGSYKITTSVPTTNHVWLLPDAAPTVDQLLKITNVSGANYTLGYISPSGLGFPTINATDGVIPYRSSSSAFSDSPITRLGANSISIGNSGAFAGLQITGSAAGSGLTVSVLSSGTNEALLFAPKGSGITGIGSLGGSTTLTGGTGNLLISGTLFTNVFNGTFQSAFGFSSSVAAIANSSAQYTWANSASPTIAAPVSDTGFARLSAGVVRVSNGSTGAGQFAVGSSTASTANQFLVDSQSTTRIAGFFSMPNGSSVATIQGVTNSIQSFAFNPSGKLQGGCNIPTATQQFSAIGNMKSDVSEVGNSGGTNTNALSFVVPANAIANNGDTVQFTTTVVFAANANNKQVDCQFAGTSVFLITSAAYADSQGQITIRIKRTGATTAKVIGTLIMSDVLLKSDCQYTDALAVTWSSNNTFQVKLQGVANSDIINKELQSDVIIAQTS